MLKRNNKERQLTNTSVWHAAGYTGEGIHVVMFDKRGTPHAHMDYASAPLADETRISHATNTTQVVHEFAPDAKITMLYSGDEGREWFRHHADTVDVINISMSAMEVTAEHSWGFLKNYEHIPVICASGNDHDDNVAYPARFPWTIAVGAYEEHDKHIPDYSNGGALLDCVGLTDIYILNSVKKEHKYNGTSTSAPQVTGALACYIQFRKDNGLPKLSAEDIRRFIHENSKDILEEGRDNESGYGLFCLPAEIPIAPTPAPPKEVDSVTDNPSKPTQPTYKDVPADFWAYDVIETATERGWFGGRSDGTFAPNEPLTRAQLAAVLVSKEASDRAYIDAIISKIGGD